MIELENVLREYNRKVLNNYFDKTEIATEGFLLELEYKKSSDIFFVYDPLDNDGRDLTIYIRKERITKNKTLLNVLLLHELLDSYILQQKDKIDEKTLLNRVKEINKRVLEYIPKEYRGKPKWTIDELHDYPHNIANKILKKSISLDKEIDDINLPLKKETIEEAINMLIKRGVEPLVATIYCFYRVSSPNI